MNILFQYLYADEQDNEVHGEAVMLNPNQLTLNAVHSEIMKLLIGGAFLIPNRLGLKTLYDNAGEDDDDYHEYEGLEETEEENESGLTIEDFLETMKKYKQENADEFW